MCSFDPIQQRLSSSARLLPLPVCSAEQRAAQEAKVLKKAGLASAYDEHDDENIRASYM